MERYSQLNYNSDASPPLMNQPSCHFRDFESKANHLGDTDGTPMKTRRHSWRQQIFLRVATPQKACDSPSRYEGKATEGSPLVNTTEVVHVLLLGGREHGPFGWSVTGSL